MTDGLTTIDTGSYIILSINSSRPQGFYQKTGSDNQTDAVDTSRVIKKIEQFDRTLRDTLFSPLPH